jgi:beta-phosphoglucomutase family hydrolase
MLSCAKGFIFDLNGTMINDMPYHTKAWHKKLVSLGSSITLEETKHQCYGKNDELLERVFPNKFTLEEKIKLGNEKEALYRIEFLPFLKLINGLAPFLEKAAAQNIKLAIGSAAIDENIAFVIDNLNIRNYFSSIVSANQVEKSKPHPETFLKCAAQLGLSPHECIVFEDSPKGVECAMNAGIKAVVILGEHKETDFAHFPNVIDCVPDYTRIHL